MSVQQFWRLVRTLFVSVCSGCGASTATAELLCTPMYTTTAASPPLRQSLWHLRASLYVGIFSALRIPSNRLDFPISTHPRLAYRDIVPSDSATRCGLQHSGILVSFAPVDVFSSVKFLTVYTSR